MFNILHWILHWIVLRAFIRSEFVRHFDLSRATGVWFLSCGEIW